MSQAPAADDGPLGTKTWHSGAKVHARTQVPVAVVLSIGLAVSAQAAEPTAAPPAASITRPAGATPGPEVAPPVVPLPAAPPSAADLLAAADAAVDAGNLNLARARYQRVVAEHPEAPEAIEARRALKVIALHAPPPDAAGGAWVGGDIILRHEPYSTRTKERLRLTTWEKLDFGVTAFLYGMSVGFSYGLSLSNQSSSDVLPPIAIGAIAYTLAAVVFLNTANPDRGDLPLALAITSYMPTTTLLVANLALDHPNSRKVAFATAITGLISVPIAVYAAHEFDLDPGDTQLVRDAGFWGLVLGTTGMLGFGGKSTNQFGFTEYQAPSSKAVSAAGFVGLYGGLGLGAVAAHFSDVSLERIRVTTWGGYGGAILGLLFATASSSNGGNSSQDLYRGLSLGAAAGLLVTFVATGSLDGIPPDDAPPAQPTSLHVTPTLSPMAGVDGQMRTMLGLSGTL